jgi:hypothetical protein
VAEAFHLVQKKNVALVPRQFFQRALQGHPQCGMCSRRPRLHSRRFLRIVVRDFFLSHPAASRVVARVNQDPVGPGDETRLPAKAGDAALYLQEGFLYGILGVSAAAKNIPSQVPHARAMNRVQPLVSAQIT